MLSIRSLGWEKKYLNYYSIYSSKSEFGRIFHQIIEVVVDQAETLRSATTESGSQSVNDDILSVSFIFGSQLGLEVLSGDIGESRMDDFDDLWEG